MNIPIVITSHLFLLNAIYSFFINEYFITLLMTSVYTCSTLYHLSNYSNVVLHYTDLCVSRITTVLLISYSTLHVHYYYSILALNNIILSYTLSKVTYHYDNLSRYWILWHIIFHLLTNFCIYVLLYNIQSSYSL